ADIDGDRTQDIIIVRPGALQLFASNNGNGLLLEFPLETGSPKVHRDAYSTAAVANLSEDPAGPYDTIVATSDGGKGHAIKNFTAAGICARSLPPCLRDAWPTHDPLDNGAAISASPIVVKVTDEDGGRPQVIIANDAGKVYILKASDGSVLRVFDL